MKKALRKLIKSKNTEEDGSQEYTYTPSKHMKLHFAILSDQEQNVRKYAFRYVNNVDSLNRTPLHLAVLQNNENFARILLGNGASTDIFDNEGYSAFLRAIEIGNVELVKLFLNENVKLQTTRSGETALHLSISSAFYNVTELLLRAGFPIDIPNNAGDYPLHIATRNDSFQTVKLLLECHANCDIEDSQKRTPLFSAVQMENVPLVQLLLKHKANPRHKDVNGKTVYNYLSTSHNAKLKSVLSVKTPACDEDSQTSESCALPPVLESPLSWNVLQLGLDSTSNEKLNDTFSRFTRFSVSEDGEHAARPQRNVKSWSFDFSNDISNSMAARNRCKSLTSYHDELLGNPINFQLSTISAIEDDYEQTNNAEKLKSKLEDCQKALEKLSLDMLNKREEEMKGRSPSPKNTNRVQSGDKEGSESSDEDPPFWKSTFHGADFNNKSDHSKNFERFSSGNDTDSGSEKSELNETSNNAVLNRLKQVSLENEDLETEASVLREATEKLKYDLANYRQLATIKDTNLAAVTAQLTQLDKKYMKSIEKIHMFQLCMSNLEQEIAHLRRICNKSCKTNEELVKQMKKIQEDNQTKSDDKAANENGVVEVGKLQADILYWKSKYEELAGEEKKTSFEMQSLFKLNFELNKLGEQIKDCLSKNDLAKLQDQQQIYIGKALQQLLNDAEHQLQSSLMDIKMELRTKVSNISEFSPEKSDMELKIMDLENTKQKLFLEVSRLSASLKEKEAEEQKLKEQLEKFQQEKQKAKEEKRKFLIRKSFEDKTSLKKGMYFSVMKNYMHRSKLSPSSPPDQISEDFEKEFASSRAEESKSANVDKKS